MAARFRFARGILPVLAGVNLLAACASKSTEATNASPAYAEDPSCAHKLTKFDGDCLVPAPIDPADGLIAHYGPRNYDDPVEVSSFIVEPGYEGIDCVYEKLLNPTDFYYQRYETRSRPGTHHVILSALKDGVPDGTHTDCEARHTQGTLLAVVQGAIKGGVYDYPPDDRIPPENEHLGTHLYSWTNIAYELHAINDTEEPLLREGWTIFRAMPASEATDPVGQMAFNGGLDMNIAPHSKATITNSCSLLPTYGDIRIVDLFGHMHAHGTRFSAWVARSGADAGARELIYESYDWSELDLIQFNSLKKNTPIEYAGGVPGGYSGILRLSANDRIEYECAVDNTASFALTFQAKAFQGEMCNMFGSFTPGTSWSCIGY
jgi:hypothetical protein